MLRTPPGYPPGVKPPLPNVLSRRLSYWARRHLETRDIKATAKAAGMSRNTLYRLMDPPPNADIYLGSVEALARALEVDPLALLQPTPAEAAPAEPGEAQGEPDDL